MVCCKPLTIRAVILLGADAPTPWGVASDPRNITGADRAVTGDLYMKFRRIAIASILSALPLVSLADLPGKHPYYLHALTDLRTARWMLEHRPGDAAVSSREDLAISEVDAAIGEIKKAAIDDGKDLHDPPAIDGPKDRPGRLHK